MADSDLLESVRRTIQRGRLFPPKGTVIVAVSGGGDSLTLMYLLSRLRDSLGVTLHIATLDHGWRGEGSAADARFVLEQAATLGLPATARKAPPHAHTEAAARRTRYDFLATVAQQVGASHIATAHHADDQAETVLLRLLRGTGLAGLAAMRPSAHLPYHPHLTLVRPLLDVTRTQIDAYCTDNGLHPRHDPTNNDPSHLRNHVRRDLLPRLETVNPQIRRGLAHLAESAATETAYLQSQADALLFAHATHTPPRWILDRAAFRTWHPALQRRAVVILSRRLTPDAEPGYTHVVAAVALALDGDPGAIAQFPGNIHMRVSYDTLVFEPEVTPPSHPVLHLTPGETYPVTLDTPLCLPNGTLTLTSENTPNPLGYLYPPAEPLALRTRQPGDRLAPPGMDGHTRKIKNWMIDRKIPAHHRNNIPLLVTGESVVAVLHTNTGTVCHPYHAPSTMRQRRIALLWQPN